ncbi:MAG: hypothetical protein Q9184_003864 [Pyrenodesmia sp. 2 TL-2023]
MSTNNEEQRKTALDSTILGMTKAKQDNQDNGFTLGWDMVVSYSEEEINGFLEAKWKKVKYFPQTYLACILQRITNASKNNNKLVTEIVACSAVLNEETSETETIKRTMNLGAPRIKFAGGAISEPAVELLMPIKDGYREKFDEKGAMIGTRFSMPDDAFVVHFPSIRLGTVTGKYEEVKQAKDKTGANPTIRSGTSPCVFRSDYSKPTKDDFEVAWVVLNIPVDGTALNASVRVLLPESHPQYSTAKGTRNAVEASVKDFFAAPGASKIDVIEYALATVKNKPQTNGSASVDLTPVRFHMASWGSSYNQKKSLSLFIETRSGSPSGKMTDLQAKWNSLWIDNNISPIPVGYSASMLINHDLAFKAMIRPGVEKNGEWKVDEERLTDKKGGVAFSMKYQPMWCVGRKSIYYSGNVRECALEIPGWHKDLKDDPLKVHIYQKVHDSAPEAHLEWSFSTECEWTDMSRDEVIENFYNRDIRSSYSIDHTFPLKITVSNTDFTFDIDTDTMTDHWKISDAEIARNGNIFMRFIKGFANLLSPSPPEHILKQRSEWMAGLKPAIDFDVVGLGFFMTTNLLSPGEKVINFDQKAGFRFPRDLLLVGDVVQGSDPLKH